MNWVVQQLLVDLLDDYYAKGLRHPRGSAGFLEDVVGIRFMALRCPLCDAEADVTSCKQCTLGRCEECAKKHDGGRICKQIVEYAGVHSHMRESPVLEQQDFYFARRMMISTLLTKGERW
jgi:hypothetical protein